MRMGTLKVKTISKLAILIAALIFHMTTATAQTAIESVPVVQLWCNLFEMPSTITTLPGGGPQIQALGTIGCNYPTLLDAAKAYAASLTAMYKAQNSIIHYGVDRCTNVPWPYNTCWLYRYGNTDPGPPANTSYEDMLNFQTVIIGCPVPTANTAAQYKLNNLTGMCERSAQNINLNITLSGSATTEPWHKKRDPEHSQANLPYQAIVKDQNGQPKANIGVTITTDVTSDSGGHVHTNGRPKGKLAASKITIKDGKETLTGTTNGSGIFEFTFGAEEASGKHKLTATCTGCNEPATPANIAAKVKEAEAPDWKTIPASPLYALQESGGEVIGAIPGVHTDNHYLTGAAIGKLGELAKIYQTVNPGQRLFLNDSSLEWGGLFDVGSTRWKTPHAGHRRGKVIDIRAANSSPVKEGAIPLLLWNEFSKEAAKQKIKAELHCFEQANLVIGPQCYFVPESRHFHVQLFSGVDQ